MGFDQLAFIKNETDTRRPFRRGIFDGDFFVGEFAADQRQGVGRSVHVELSPAVEADLVKDEV